MATLVSDLGVISEFSTTVPHCIPTDELAKILNVPPTRVNKMMFDYSKSSGEPFAKYKVSYAGRYYSTVVYNLPALYVLGMLEKYGTQELIDSFYAVYPQYIPESVYDAPEKQEPVGIQSKLVKTTSVQTTQAVPNQPSIAFPEPAPEADPFENMEFDISLATQPGSEELTMSSLQIAELTGKQHGHVCYDITLLEQRLKVIVSKTRKKSGGKGRPTNVYHLNRTQAFSLLCNYSQILAAKIVTRWLELEKQVQQQQESTLVLHSVQKESAPGNIESALGFPVDQVSLLRMLADKIETEKAKDARIAVLEPKAELADVVLESPDLMKMADTAKMFGTGLVRLFGILREQNVIIPGTRVPYQPYIDNGCFVIKKKMLPNNTLEPVTLVTNKGIELIHRILKKLATVGLCAPQGVMVN